MGEFLQNKFFPSLLGKNKISFFSDCWNKDKITEYLDENPSVFQEYLECNPQLLDKYVTSQVDEQTIAKWLEKIDQRAS